MHIISLTKSKQKIPRSVALLLVVLLAGAVYVGWRTLNARQSNPTRFTGETTEPPPPPPKEPNVLNGLLVDPAVAKRRPLAIMVENHVAARPQIGLTKAAIVYEAIAEGGITRFMAVFGPFDADKVGPVRSARQYYVEWAKGLDALYAHVGGSADARALIKTIGLADLDQFRYGLRAYHREQSSGLATEHTMMTSTPKLYQVAGESNFDLVAKLTPYLFKEDALVEARGPAHTISVPFSSAVFNVVWTYDPVANVYLRTHGGVDHVDRLTGERIIAKNVMVATLQRRLKPEGQGTGWHMTTTGSGSARVFRDGKEYAGTWKRANNDEMIRFFDEAGTENVLNRGQIWIEILHPGLNPTVQQ